MIWQFVKNFVCTYILGKPEWPNMLTFGLPITYTYWTLADARVKKDEHLENQKCYLNLK